MKILKILIISSLILLFGQIQIALAVGIDYALEVPLPGMSVVHGPADYLSNIYKIALGAGVFTAAVVIIYAGIMMAISGDNPSKQKDARDQIFQAILGLIILFGSYLILNTINPDLVRLGKWQNLPSFQIIPQGEMWPNDADCQVKRQASANCVAKLKKCDDPSLSPTAVQNCQKRLNAEMRQCCLNAGVAAPRPDGSRCGNCELP